MYRILIVDDEEIEREGMAEFIPWEQYGFQLVGTAWNGVEGFEKIRTECPDIVLTDIKMPVMDGIELIKKTRKNFPEVEFVVLSGYGEYEFTSKAMEEGIRYYILKPCDESKIMSVLERVKEEIEEKKEKKQEESAYYRAMNRLLPRAKEHIFRNMLLNKEQPKEDYALFLKELGNSDYHVQVLALKIAEGFDYLEQFILGSIIRELLEEETVLLSTSIGDEMLFLLDAEAGKDLETAVKRAESELQRVKKLPIHAAVSKAGKLEEVSTLYKQIQELFRIGNAEHRSELLYYELFRDAYDEADFIVDYKRIQKANDYAEILFEVYLAFLKMELRKYTFLQKAEMCTWVLKVLYGEEKSLDGLKQDTNTLFVYMINYITEKQGLGETLGKEQQRIREILLAVYENLENQEMNIQYLAKEVLYMNVDYFSRLFVKNRGIKFSSFLLELRITLAQRLLQYDHDLRIAQVAELVGYSPDGQYFSKAFRKAVGMSPTEYRDMLKMNE